MQTWEIEQQIHILEDLSTDDRLTDMMLKDAL